MGLFQRKKEPKKKSHSDEMTDIIEQHFFTEHFRDELRSHGRWYFEKIISENGELFKQELDVTIAQVKTGLKDHLVKNLDTTMSQLNTQIKEYVAKQLGQQLATHAKAMKDSQDAVLQSLTQSTKALQEQHQQLSQVLQKNITEQEQLLAGTFTDNKNQIEAIKNAQAAALQSLTQSTKALQEQHQQLSQVLQTNVANQEAMLIDVFQENMAQIVEHYLLSAVGEEYDMKAQLPAIIKQMEAHKQEMVDDIKL